MLLLISAALGGTVEVQTTTPAEIHLNGVEVLRLFGPSTAILPEVPAGEMTFVVYRGGQGAPIEVAVPESGKAVIRIGEELLETDHQPDPVDGPAPTVALRSGDGQPFTIILDGRRLGTLAPDAPMSLDDLTPGAHALEVRSTDLLVVWLRGTLHLQPGDEIILQLTEGRMVEVFGRTEAWQAGN